MPRGAITCTGQDAADPCMSCFAHRVASNHEAGNRVGPPPAKDCVAHQAKQHHTRQTGIDHGHARLGHQYGIAQRLTGDGFSSSQGKHHHRGDRRPDNPQWAGLRYPVAGQRHHRLHCQV